MRVTQSMLSNNMLLNLNNSYSKMSKLQNQITSGSKITRPSDDPVIAVKGMGYRRDLGQVEQYTRNMNEVNNWIDTTDESLNQVGEQMKRVRELVIQAANDTNTPDERAKIKSEIDQIRQQIQDVGNTKIADRYIFSGTRTTQPLFENGAIDPTKVNSEDVVIEVYDGIQMKVNTPGAELFKNVDDMMGKISDLLDPNRAGGPATGEEIGNALGGVAEQSKGDDITAMHNKILEAQADIGARQNRVELMENRLAIREVSVTKQFSDNEDVDYAKAITEMVTSESIHQAALSVGAKIIQQTLVDFIR
ncbi:flagellar hook protein FlgL [Lysinibacillus sphaericus]|uniref:flagellar hook-associated protein FlgL n=1 Tax=Lysinibacillus sphaericus TaxID=1421 RepID=UPI0018CDA9F9|nr:flagellar hook-associated protein FlgL [Lysinibacillus sphaericus]MBG9454816.1 flagellar hook protein FlgL [Lysinibacillus sphaericus]MBG9478244.1 flagellar hook protein FlgL [Lysinibacillus sphaericus]MBG9590957.1 flagellar hook protein FlgL [Lysinibacillus sphaericus]